MAILNFNNFITEKMGVAESSLIFVPLLMEKIQQRFIHFFESEKKDSKYIENIRFNSLKPLITDVDLYLKFPVVGFDIQYVFIKYTDYDFCRSFPITSQKAPVTIGGSAQAFGNKNWTKYSRLADPEMGAEEGLILFMDIEVHVNDDLFHVNDEVHLDLFQEGVEATLYHELNHFYEMYYLTKRNVRKGEARKPFRDRGSLNPAITHVATDKIIGVPANIVRYWTDEFVFFTYLCEDFELKSHVQEVDYYFKKHPQQPIVDNRVFKNYDKLSKFKTEEFYQGLAELVEAWGKDNPDSVLDKLKTGWVSSYEEVLKNFKSPAIAPIPVFKKMSGLEFVKWWESKFHEKGEYVKRKIYKLASSYNISKNNDNDE